MPTDFLYPNPRGNLTLSQFNEQGVGYENPGFDNTGLSFSITDFTYQTRYQTLTQRINDGISSGDGASMVVNSSLINLDGPTFQRVASEITPNSDSLNKLGGVLSGIDKTVQTSVNNKITDAIQGRVDTLGVNKPNVTINLSSEGTIPSGTIDLKKYTPMSNIVKTSWEELAKSIDKQIKDNFFVQLFNLKATDIMCSGVCIIFALMPCKVANQIIDAIRTVQEYQTMIKSSVSQLNGFNEALAQTVNSSFGNQGPLTGIANIKDFSDTVKTAVNGMKNGQNNYGSYENAMQMIQTAIQGASTIIQTLNLLISISKISIKDIKNTWAWVENGIYTLLNAVLQQLQAMAIQIADSLLNKVIAPVEKLFKNFVPEQCGLLAKIFFAKVIATIYNFKNKLLEFIKGLFQFMKIEQTKFELFTKDAPWTLQLSAFLKLFNILIDNFLDISIGCGVQKRICKEDENTSLINPSMSTPYTDTSFRAMSELTPQVAAEKLTEVKPIAEMPKTNNLDELSKKMENYVKIVLPDSTISIGPQQSTIKALTNMPVLIRDILNNTSLGPGVTIYKDDLGGAKIVYQNPALCGAN